MAVPGIPAVLGHPRLLDRVYHHNRRGLRHHRPWSWSGTAA
jgi:hypothetical protein